MSEKNLGGRPTIERSIEELEQILASMESGTTTLEESLARYERGVALLKNCYETLAEAEMRILKVTNTEEGAMKFDDFAHSASMEVKIETTEVKPTRPRRKPPEAEQDIPF